MRMFTKTASVAALALVATSGMTLPSFADATSYHRNHHGRHHVSTNSYRHHGHFARAYGHRGYARVGQTGYGYSYGQPGYGRVGRSDVNGYDRTAEGYGYDDGYGYDRVQTGRSAYVDPLYNEGYGARGYNSGGLLGNGGLLGSGIGGGNGLLGTGVLDGNGALGLGVLGF